MDVKTNDKKQYICENCGASHDGSYGSGRFCCMKCARAYPSRYVSENGRKKQKEALTCLETRKKIAETRYEKTKKNKKKKEKLKKNKCKKKKSGEKKQRKPDAFDKDILDREIAAKNLFNDKFKGDTQRIGTYGENVIINKCLEHDIPVYKPIIDNDGIDMIIEINGELKKVQVKTASEQYGVNKDKVGFQLSKTRIRHDQESGLYKAAKYHYKSNVDLFALYDIIHDKSYLVENDNVHSTISISQSRSVNSGNDKRMHYCDDYDFDHVIEDMKAGINQRDIVEGTFEEIILDVDKK